MKVTRQHFIVLAPILAIFFYLLLSQLGLAHKPAITAAITLLTVIWWITEAIPIPATSLVPFALLPIFDIADHKTVASSLGSHVILLLMGAFMVSTALVKSGAHERMAVYMIRLVGVTSGKRLVFGFMMATAILSMWISNTASTLIMLPIALAILSHVNTNSPKTKKLKVALILGIAYSASVGGIGTPIGTPPNAIFMAVYEEITGKDFGFFTWMKIGIPVVFISIPLMALWLTRSVSLDETIKLPTLSQWRTEEKRTLYIFSFTAIAWITRGAPFGGWSSYFNTPLAGDSTVALIAVIIMFMTPNGKGGRILDWATAKEIPWGMLLLFAGGIALAKGFSASGLSSLLGEWLSSLANLPMIAMVLTICLVVTYVTEITSNTATATLLMPILAVVGITVGVDPAIFMIPAAMAANCAFMLPVATAPNAIAYGTGEIEMRDMVIEGAILSFLISCIVGCVTYFLLFY